MISEQIVSEVRAASECTEVTPGNRRELKYPKLIPLFHFTVRRYRCPFGNLLTMDTDAMGGKMLLSTVVFTPDTGRSLPVLLIDSMDMKKKSLMYAEYYDCTASGAVLPAGDTQKAEFSGLPDYAEKPAWYIERRMPCSLIKGGDGCPPEKLREMALTCVRRYLEAAGTAETDRKNLAGLQKFQDEMWTLGNPSSDILTKALGKKDAEIFFRNMIMPVQNGNET